MNRKYGQTGEELCDEIISCIDKEFLPGFFRKLCGIWLEKHSNKLHPSPLRFRETMWENPRAFRNLHLMEIRSMMTGDEIWNLSEQNPDMFYKVWAQFTS